MPFAWLKRSDVIRSGLPEWPLGSRKVVSWQSVVDEVRLYSPGCSIAAPLDSAYMSVPAAILKSAVDWTRRDVEAFGLKYTPETYDCDDAAADLDRVVSRMAAKAGFFGIAPAIGCAWVRMESAWGKYPAGGSHEVNLVMTDAGLAVVDMQTGQTCPLSEFPNRSALVALSDF